MNEIIAKYLENPGKFRIQRTDDGIIVLFETSFYLDDNGDKQSREDAVFSMHEFDIVKAKENLESFIELFPE